MDDARTGQPSYNKLIDDLEKLRILDQMYQESPPCFNSMQGKVLDFEPGQEFTICFPVLDNYLNPAGSMQGGIIGAAFDNVFGPLCWSVSGKPNGVMTEMNTSYHRPIFKDDCLNVKAFIKVQGQRKLHMAGEAFNNSGKLIATAVATYWLFD